MPVPPDKGLHFLGPALLTIDDSLVYLDGKWISVPHPTNTLLCARRWTNTFGYQGCLERASGDVVFFRSQDTLRSWRPWFRVEAHVLALYGQGAPVGALGALASGRIWWPLASANVWRGTDDGENWVAFPTPDNPGFELTTGRADTFYARGLDWNGQTFGLITTDGGAHWDSLRRTEPGGLRMRTTSWNAWFATSEDTSGPIPRVRSWWGSSCQGPWEALPDSTTGLTTSPDGTLLATIGGRLEWLLPEGAETLDPRARRFRTSILRLDHAGWSVSWRTGATAGPWRLLSGDGRVLSYGILGRGQRRLGIPFHSQTGWLVVSGAEAPLTIPGAARH